MPMQTSFLERTMLVTLNQGPGVLLDVFGALAFPALRTAHNLDVFEALSAGPLTAAELAEKIGADARGTRLLLEALEALGYLAVQDGRYRNTAMTAKWTTSQSSSDLSVAVPFWAGLLQRWEHLEETVRHGKPPQLVWEWMDQHPNGWRDYEKAMIAMARMSVDEVVAKVKLPAAARRLLDVGGGHGLYSIRFCQRNPQLSATVFDWPQALEVARETIAAENMGARVNVQAGDFTKDPLPDGYDVALLFNVIHIFSSGENTEILRKINGALNPGGMVVIMDQLEGKAAGKFARIFASLQALNQFNEVGGQCWTFEEIGRWFQAAGFGQARRINLLKAPGLSVVTGVKTR